MLIKDIVMLQRPLAANDMMLFHAANAIERTRTEMRRLQTTVGVAPNVQLKTYIDDALAFERETYVKDLDCFKNLAGHYNWQQYI